MIAKEGASMSTICAHGVPQDGEHGTCATCVLQRRIDDLRKRTNGLMGQYLGGGGPGFEVAPQSVSIESDLLRELVGFADIELAKRVVTS